MESSQKVIVLGSGVVGLSTAISIQQKLPKVKVTVIAEKVHEDTTTFGAAGIFIPMFQGTVKENDVLKAKYRRWIETSGKSFITLAMGPEGGSCGIMLSTGYKLYNENPSNQDPLYKHIIFNRRQLSDREMSLHGFDKYYKYATEETTVKIESGKYLKWLEKRFLGNGGILIRRKISSLEEIDKDCLCVVNCCGFGSRELFGDKTMFAVRGQVVRVHAPWVNHWVYVDHTTYIFPGEHLVTLGGTSQKGNESVQINADDKAGILERCKKILPRLQESRVDHDWVGLRPCREGGVRIEEETFNIGGHPCQVIHNYGHGTSGVALSWGTAQEASDLVMKCVKLRSAHL